MFGLSKEYLLRLFKKEVGVGFSTYSTQARMTLAAEMLASQSLPTKAIALALGYSDVANFHRDFKRAHGMTPRQWRLEKLVSPIPMNERRAPAAMSVSDPKAGTA